MIKNIISTSQFGQTNNTSIEFLPSSLLKKDLRMGAILLKGQTKDGVYEWSINSTIRFFVNCFF